jgi:hypothetical protein
MKNHVLLVSALVLAAQLAGAQVSIPYGNGFLSNDGQILLVSNSGSNNGDVPLHGMDWVQLGPVSPPVSRTASLSVVDALPGSAGSIDSNSSFQLTPTSLLISATTNITSQVDSSATGLATAQVGNIIQTGISFSVNQPVMYAVTFDLGLNSNTTGSQVSFYLGFGGGTPCIVCGSAMETLSGFLTAGSFPHGSQTGTLEPGTYGVNAFAVANASSSLPGLSTSATVSFSATLSFMPVGGGTIHLAVDPNPTPPSLSDYDCAPSSPPGFAG